MDLQNPGNGSSSLKRKRGRPRKDESMVCGERVHATPQSEKMKDIKQSTDLTATSRDDMLGQVVYGVIDGKFDAGYLVNVRVGNADVHLRGVVFLPGQLVPVTAANDLAPEVRMCERTDIPFPVPNSQSRQSQFSSSAHVNEPEHKDVASTFEGYGQPSDEVKGPVSQHNQSASAMQPFTNSSAVNQGGFSSKTKNESQSASLDIGMLCDEAFEEKKCTEKSAASMKSETAEVMETNETSMLVPQSSHCGNLVPEVEDVDRIVQVKHQVANSDLEATRLVEDEPKSPTFDHNKTQASPMDIKALELATNVVDGDASDDPNTEPPSDAANVTSANSPRATSNEPSTKFSIGDPLASTPEPIEENPSLEGVIVPQLSVSSVGT